MFVILSVVLVGGYLALAIALVSRWVCAAMACAKCAVGESLRVAVRWGFLDESLFVSRGES